MLGRGFVLFLLVVTGLVFYALGYWQGQREPQENAGLAGLPLPSDFAEVQNFGSTAVAPLPAQSPGFDELLDAAAWFQLERWLVANRNVLTYSHGAALTKTLAAKINKYDAVAMRRVLRAYLDEVPDDAGALFMLSDLQQVGGLREAALETLISILDYPFEASIAAKATRAADQIIKVIDLELKNGGALAEREAFWRHISQRVSSSDAYRFQWAGSLTDLKRFDEAARVLAETGTSDIAQATLDELLLRIETAQDAQGGIQFQRDGSRMLSYVTTPTGLSLTLLVDTGANVTSLSKSALRLVAAHRLNEQVRVSTANGVVTTGVYRVAELEVQGRRFTDLRVIELPVELPDLDGLLGLDILDQLSPDPISLHPI